MKIPLRYQTSEFDCGPTALMNCVSLLYDCETIPPDIPQKIGSIGNDEFDPEGRAGRLGTSAAALRYAADWLTLFGRQTGFPIRCVYLSGRRVNLDPDSELRRCLELGGAAVVRCLLSVGHYITLTGILDGKVSVFDPYFREKPLPEGDAEFVYDSPKTCNRILTAERLDSTEERNYSMGKYKVRAAVLFYKTGEPPSLDV